MRVELDDFIHHCRVERRLAPLTCSAYERDVGACLAFLEAEGFTSWGDVGPAHLRRFLAAESERRPAASSQARTVAALKGFFRVLVENEAIERNPALVLRTPKKREALPDVLDQRELQRLLGAADQAGVWEREHKGSIERVSQSTSQISARTPGLIVGRSRAGLPSRRARTRVLGRCFRAPRAPSSGWPSSPS